MHSNSTLDQPQNLQQSKANRLRKLGIYATVFFSLMFLLLSYFFTPEIVDESLFNMLSSGKSLPDFVIYLFIVYGASILALFGAIMLIRKNHNGLYIFLIGDVIWLFMCILSIVTDGINVISIFYILIPIILLILALSQMKSKRSKE